MTQNTIRDSIARGGYNTIMMYNVWRHIYTLQKAKFGAFKDLEMMKVGCHPFTNEYCGKSSYNAMSTMVTHIHKMI